MPSDAVHYQMGDVGPGAMVVQGSGNVVGFAAEQVQALIETATGRLVDDKEKVQRELDELRQQTGLTQGAALSVLRAMDQQDVPFEQLPQKLTEAAAHYRVMKERLAALSPALDADDPVIAQFIKSAQEAIESGRFGKADQLLNRAVQVDLAAAYQAKAILAQAQAAADRRFLRAAEQRGVQGNLARTRLDYLTATQHFAEAADLVPASHPDERAKFLLQQADALERHGDERGDNTALRQAIEVYDRALELLPRGRVPLQWAMTQNNLGTALRTLGERESGRRGWSKRWRRIARRWRS